MKELFDSLGWEERDVVRAFVRHGSTSVTWGKTNRSIEFSHDGIDSLVYQGLIDLSVTADGGRETFVLERKLFEYAQSVFPDDRPDVPF